MMVRTTDADEAAASDLVDGGRRESSAGGASDGGCHRAVCGNGGTLGEVG